MWSFPVAAMEIFSLAGNPLKAFQGNFPLAGNPSKAFQGNFSLAGNTAKAFQGKFSLAGAAAKEFSIGLPAKGTTSAARSLRPMGHSTALR